MNIQLIDEDAILLLLTYIPEVMILQVLQKVNKQLYAICNHFIEQKSKIFGGYKGLQYDIIFNQIKNNRDYIMSNLKSPKTWKKQDLNMIRWSKHNGHIFGLYNIYNTQRIMIWLGLSDSKCF